MSDQEKIINRIKKLLRMKNGGTAAEIETALLLAQQIAHKHGIDIKSINENELEREPITHENINELSRIQWECKYAALIMQEHFNVKVFVRKSIFHDTTKLIFIGTKTDIEIARYIYNFLVRHFRQEWKLKKGRLRNRQAFMFGMFCGLNNKLNSLKPKIEQQEGIILSGDKLRRNDYMEKTFGETKSESVNPDNIAVAAVNAGYQAGRQTNIRTGLRPPAQLIKELA